MTEKNKVDTYGPLFLINKWKKESKDLVFYVGNDTFHGKLKSFDNYNYVVELTKTGKVVVLHKGAVSMILTQTHYDMMEEKDGE